MGLAEKLSSTTLDYILTPEEEAEAIAYAIKQKRGKIERKALLMGKLSSDINGSEFIDKDSVLSQCNANKHRANEQKKDLELKNAEMERQKKELAEKWTASYFFNYLRAIANYKGKDLISTGQMLPLIKTWCYYLSNDERFTTELGYDINKGLLFRGECGLGKTFIPTCLMDNDLKPIGITSLLEISEDVRDNGTASVNPGKVIYLDDLGTEEKIINYYGTKIRWFKDFFEKFYLDGKGFNRLVVSTNLSFDQLEEMYGFRVRDRIKDVFNIVNVTGESLRK